MTDEISSVRYTTTRFTIDTGETSEAFRTRYEQAVPLLPREKVAELARRKAPWSQMLDPGSPRQRLWASLSTSATTPTRSSLWQATPRPAPAI